MLKKFFKAKPKLASSLKFGLKIALSALAIYLVFTQINLEDVWGVLQGSSIPLLLVAVFFFNISKGLSSRRLLLLFRELGIDISAAYNLRLYYIGMFYNLFLPGGIGGDGYKVYHLRSRSESTSKLLVAAVLLDRIAGAATLCFLGLAILCFYKGYFIDLPSWAYPLTITAAIVSIPSFLGLLQWFFPTFKSLRIPLVLWSLGVQIAQLLSAICILWACGVETNIPLYLVLFLFSSIAAMLPISFGGVGLRELVFLYTAQFLPIDQNAAVALGLVFFLITAISSLVGAFIPLPDQLST